MLNSVPFVKLVRDSKFNSTRITTFELTIWQPLLNQLYKIPNLVIYPKETFLSISSTVDNLINHPWGPRYFNTLDHNNNVFTIYDEATLSKLHEYWEGTSKGIGRLIQVGSDITINSKPLLSYPLTTLGLPSSSINVLITSSDWTYLLKHIHMSGASHELKDIAHAVSNALNASSPTDLYLGQWHLPFDVGSNSNSIKQDIETGIKKVTGLTTIDHNEYSIFPLLDMIVQAMPDSNLINQYGKEVLTYKQVIDNAIPAFQFLSSE